MKTADPNRYRTAWMHARERAAGEREAAQWTRDELTRDLAALKGAVARYLGSCAEGQDVSEYDLTAYLAHAGVDLTAEIAAHRALLDG